MSISGRSPQNALAIAVNPPPEVPQGYVRNEATGSTTYFPPVRSSPAPRVRVIGVGGGDRVDLGEEQSPLPPLDYSRPGIEIPGIGKGLYSRDGRFAIFDDGQGGKVKVVLGYDAEASRRLTMQNLEMEKFRQDMAATQEQILASRDARTRRENPEIIPGAGYSQAFLEKQYGKAPEGSRWNVRGQLEKIPGSEDSALSKATEDEKRSAGLAIRMENALADMNAKPEGAKPQVIPEVLRRLPLVGEALANKATPYERQTVEAAQLDALDAALTLATGAAYTKEQLAGLSKSYFPQLGDDDRTIADKKSRLSDVIETARIRAGRASGTIGKVTGNRNRGVSSAPPAAVDYLRANDSQAMRATFDAKYGKGASAAALGR